MEPYEPLIDRIFDTAEEALAAIHEDGRYTVDRLPDGRWHVEALIPPDDPLGPPIGEFVEEPPDRHN